MITPDGVSAGLPDRPYSVLPVLPALEQLLPAGGLAKGSVVSVDQPGMLCIALLAGVSRASLWCAVAGLPGLGVAAAAGAGVNPDRMMLVPRLGPRWAEATATLLGACEVVLLEFPGRVPPSTRRRLESAAREHGSVLIVAGAWEGAPLRLRVAQQVWEGIGDGYGRLRACRAEVTASGRGGAARPRRVWLWLPGPDGTVTAAEPWMSRPGTSGDGSWRAAGTG